MAVINYTRSLIRMDTATEFFYSAPYEWQRDGIGSEQQDLRIPSGESNGADGEYQSDSYLSPRTFSYKLKVIGTDYGDLLSKMDVLWAAHTTRGLCRLRRQTVSLVGAVATSIRDVFLECRISALSKGVEHTGNWAEPEISVRSGHPVYQDTSLQAAVGLNANGTTGVTPGGTERCAPIFSLTVTAAGVVTLLESAFGKSIAFTVAPGVYTIDMSQPVPSPVFFGGVTTIGAIVAGGAFKLSPLPSNVTVTPSAGAAISAASVTWRRCWTFS